MEIVTLLTDFGITDAFVGVMKGVMLGINPRLRFVDLTHQVPRQQVLAGALLLRSAVDFFAQGTIHLAVVDPGVGSERRPLLIETERGFLVGPDNGLLWPAATRLGCLAVRAIENQEFMQLPVSQTFHGRDVFAPAAAHLSRGIPPHLFGPRLDSVVELSLPTPRVLPAAIEGEVIHVDHFGNLVTNIDARLLSSFSARTLSVNIKGTAVAGLIGAYSAVAEGQPLAIVGSWGMLEVAVRNGDAAHLLAAGLGSRVVVVLESSDR